ncbi:MAG: gluconokinase [Spirochaetota bacterium]
MSEKNYIIALDMGTTSTKGILYRINGDIEAIRSQDYSTYYPALSLVEQDPDDVLRAVIQVVGKLMKESALRPQDVSALVFGGILHSMIPVDRHCTVLNRALIWADLRATEQSGELQSRLDKEEVRERTGCSLHPMYYLPRLLWFKQQAREILKRTYKFISVKGYILYHLFGEFVIDRSIASGTGVWNMHTLDWDQELLQHAGMDRCYFSRVEETTCMTLKLNKKMASRMGLLEGTPGVVGASDGPMAHLGSVGMSRDLMSMTVATGAALRRRVPEPMVLRGREAWCYYMSEGTWLLGGVMHDAGIVMRWFADNFIQDANKSNAGTHMFELLNTYASQVPPGSEGLLFFPFLGGERCPHHNPEIRGEITGLSFGHNKKHLVRALMEGISYRLFSIYRMLSFDREIDPVVTGGILKSPVWLQIICDFFGKSFWKPQVSEGSAWGEVLVALRALGIIAKTDEIDTYVKHHGKIDPQPQVHQVYQEMFHRYNELYRERF